MLHILQSSEKSIVQVCVCGAVFPPDLLFCRKCGSQWQPCASKVQIKKSADILEPCLRAWRQSCNSKKAEELALEAQLLTWQVSVQLGRDLRHWHSWAKVVRDSGARRRAIDLRHIRFMDTTRMASSLRRWAAFAGTQAQCKHLIARNRRRVNHAAQLFALRMLCRNVSRRRHIHLSEQAGSTQTLRKHQKETLALWHNWSLRRQKIRGLAQRALAIMALSLKSRAWQCWCRRVRTSNAALAFLTELACGVGKRLVEVYFSMWCESLATLRRHQAACLRVELSVSQRLSISSFNIWRRVAEQWKSQRFGLWTVEKSICVRLAEYYLWLWRDRVESEKFERQQCMLSATHHRKRHLAQHFADWHAAIAELYQARQRMLYAMSHDCRILMHVALTQWCFYFSRLQKKRRSPHVHSAVSSIIIMRRRHRFRAWVKALAALARSGHAQHKFALGTETVFSAWVDAFRKRSERSDDAFVAWQKRRKSIVLARISKLWRARRLGRLWYMNDLKHIGIVMLHEWKLNAHNEGLAFQARIEYHISRKKRKSLASALHCFRRALFSRQAYLGHIFALEALLGSLAGKFNRSLQSTCMRQWLGWVSHDRAIEGLHYEQGDTCQRILALRRWYKHCRYVQNKRRVHSFCDGYRNAHLLQYALALWQEVHIRLRSIEDAVLTWTSDFSTTQASRILLAWSALAHQRRTCRKNVALLLSIRKRRVFQLWDFAIEDKVEAAYAASRWSLAWVRSRLAGWYATSVRRRRGQIATEAVHKARQRRWIEQWSSAGRWDRLTTVAKSWDEKVRGNRCLSEAFWMWQDVVLTIFRAGVAADRVGKMHALIHFRSWWKLWRKLSQASALIRVRKVTRALSSWRHFSKTSRDLQKQKTRVSLDGRLTRSILMVAISRFDSYCGERRRRRIGDREHLITMVLGRSRRKRKGVLSWWSKWATRHKDKLADKIETVQGQTNGREQWERFCDILRPRELQVRDPLKLTASSLRDFLEIQSLKDFVLPPTSERRVLRLKGVPLGSDVAEVDHALEIYHIGQANIALCRGPGHHATGEALVIFPNKEAAASAVKAGNVLHISGKKVEFAGCVEDTSIATSRLNKRSSFETITNRVRSVAQNDLVGEQLWRHYCDSTRRGSYDPTTQTSEFLNNYLDAYEGGKLSVKLQLKNGRVEGRRMWLKEVESRRLVEDEVPRER